MISCPHWRRRRSISSISGSGAPRIHTRGDMLISVLLLDSRTQPLTRDRIRLTVLDRLEPLLTCIATLRPRVVNQVVTAVRTHLGDLDASTMTPDPPLAPVVLVVRAGRLLRIERDCVP